MTRDGDKLSAWLREAADELDKAHTFLDFIGAPRANPVDGVEFTLAARIAFYTHPPNVEVVEVEPRQEEQP